MNMIRYELKKVFSRTGSRIALLVLLIVTAVTCYFAADITYVDADGTSRKGPSAAAALKSEQKAWAGQLDEERIRKVIAENRRIRATPEYNSKDLTEKEIAYSQGQGIQVIRDLLNASYADGFRDYNYYRADSLTESDAPQFYKNRIRLLKEWLAEEAKDQYSDAEKEYLISQYQNIKTPFFYDYITGWVQLFEYSPAIIMITLLVLGYLSAEIFASEFAWKTDAIFFSSFHGRKKAVQAKIKAGFLMVTVIYFAVFLLYAAAILLYLGTDGWNLAVQVSWTSWKCFYNILIWQKFLLIMAGGYTGCLFISFLSMFVSAKSKSAVLAVMIPFILIFIPSFLGNINHPAVSKILGLLPDQLLQISSSINYFNVYSAAGIVTGAVPVLLILYSVLTAGLLPVLYQVYRKKQIS